MRNTRQIFTVLAMSGIVAAHAQQPVSKEQFNILDLGYPGLEKVKADVNAGQYNHAAAELLSYFREKYAGKEPDFSNAENPPNIHEPVSKAARAAADSALQHKFQPHKGYGFFDYGKDINWQLWPVKDNEVRWQLHRVKWWQPMALMYRSTKDERYAREWMFQYTDWAKKNPLGLSDENDKYVWRPLEVSDRVQSLVPTFSIFIHSPGMTPEFLMEFLNSYNQQADYLPSHYAEKGNHRLFEAQRVLFAGASFPELKNAPTWRESGISVLNTEMKKQVYPDGMQFELSPAYHIASIDIFLKAYHSAKTAGLEKEFPASYSKTIEEMIMAMVNFSFPDYQSPMFGDSWLADKNVRIRQYQNWLKVFPQNEIIRYYATAGREGRSPAWLSKGLTTAGFYTFRNGWDKNATVMVLKASPPAFFHAQPDNGTFELWVKGRNFTPDAGVFVYSGDEEIMKLRESYRQTRRHNTLTLDDKNMVITKASLQKWETGKTFDVLTYTNPSYEGLDHQRSVLFIDQKYFLIADLAKGNATGTTGVHFHLKEDCNPVLDTIAGKLHTTYSDGNNLLLQSFTPGAAMRKDADSKVSYEYRKEMVRPAVVFEKLKTDKQSTSFLSIVYPYQGDKAPAITVKENPGNDIANNKLDIDITINGKTRKITADL